LLIIRIVVPRVLLRTKLIPEIEKEEERLRKLADPGAHFDDNTSFNTMMNESSVLKASKKIKTKCEVHDALTTECLDLFTSLKDEFDFRMRLPPEIGRQAAAATELEDTNMLVDAEMQKTERKETLEDLLKWINSGPEYRQTHEH
jgi:hypothetical protein